MQLLQIVLRFTVDVKVSYEDKYNLNNVYKDEIKSTKIPRSSLNEE